MRILAFASLLLIAAAEPPALFTPEDLNRLADVSEPVFTPDGVSVVYTVTTRNTAIDAKVSDIWAAPIEGGPLRQLTRTGTVSEWQPRPSADGQRVFFLSDGTKDETVQLWSIPSKGGKPRQITHVPGGISDFALSPDSDRAVVIAEIGGAPAPNENQGAKRGQSPIVIDRLNFREDYRGWIDARTAQLLLIDLAGKADPVQLTFGSSDVHSPSWSPDGKHIAYVGFRDEAADRIRNSDIFLITPEAGAEPRTISTSPNADNDPSDEPMRPAWSPDSQRLAWVTRGETKWIFYSPFQLTIADLATGEMRDVAHIDRSIYHPRWSADGKKILALIEQDRDTWLAEIDPASDTIRYLTSGARFAVNFAAGPNDQLIVLEGDQNRPYLLRRADKSAGVIADHNQWLAQRQLADIQDISFVSADGTEIHGMLALPPKGAMSKDGKPALIVRVHGGPVYQFSHEFMDDWQAFAARGYAVLAVNPRGSSGRGFDFARAIYADWGHKDVEDVKAGIDWVLAQGLADPDRVGIGGWSYGGILSNYMIARDPRIRAAVSGAGASNFAGLWGIDQYARDYEIELGTPWENRENWDRVSYPFFEAGNISAATLFLCAEEDKNVPCAGSQQMYQALRSRGVPTRLVIYPGENHGLVVPSNLVDRVVRSLEWYDRHLSGE